MALAATPARAADDVVLKRFKSGAGPDAVGMVDPSEDTELAGPQALYAGDNGELLLLDQINGRVLRFDPKHPAAATQSLALPQDLSPSDLIVHDRDIVVWDGAAHTLQPTGQEDAPERGLEELPTRGAEDESVRSTFAQMGSQAPDSNTDLVDENSRGVSIAAAPPARQIVASHGAGTVVATVVRNKNGSDVTIGVRSREHADAIAVLHLQVRDRLGTIELLDIDKHGRMFVLAEDIPQESRHRASAFVARFAANGKMEGVYELPLADSVALSRRFVTVSEDGDVYYLRMRRAEAVVLGVGFRPLHDDALVDTRARTESHTNTTPRRKGVAIAAGQPLTRQRIIATAFAFEGARWHLTPSAYGDDPDTACAGIHRIRRPAYLNGALGHEVRGIPYCWGCQGSLTEILTEIDRGELAGNVCTHNTPRSGVVGVDCSAFVSAVWGLQTHFSTAAIPSISTPLSNVWDLQPGDALNKPGSHVMLFLRFTPDRKAEVMEAAPGACNGRVCRNIYPLSSLLARGFEPVRYRAVASDNMASVSAANHQDADDMSKQGQDMSRPRHARHRRHGGTHGKKSLRTSR
jgi:hypothetical protein